VVYGETTPSSTGVEIVGETRDDYAVCVHFAEPDRDLWLPEESLELVDHGEGTTMEVRGVTYVRRADGEWRKREST
jgi:hypothetical protein